ncbi:MAG TPA: extracellular solute-binding protein [Polyangia bacterium]|nr:extracellular solute-binding protein [Polyangia bacterium]
MRRSAIASGAALVVVLCVPFVVRVAASSSRAVVARAGVAETLVILTPNNEAIRVELERGFRASMARQGRTVAIDWRTPGGASEIARYVASEYAASFHRRWTDALHKPWSAAIAAGFSHPAEPGEPGEVADARAAFLASDVGCGIDLLFGGPSPDFAKHAAAGRLVDAGLAGRLPALFGEGGIPRTFRGQTFWDRDGRWTGTCLSSFGICTNRDALARLGVPRPSSWEALADPVLAGEVALADPTKSSSVATAFETIVQVAMSRAFDHARATGADEAAATDAARHAGWDAGMRLIRRIGANARYFTDSATKIPLDVSMGEGAAGLCIDFYGRAQGEAAAAAGDPGRVGFAPAVGEMSYNADPIGLLRGAPHRELAVAFMEFVLSDEGQKIWSFRRGAPGGPERYALRRLPISPHLYDHAYDADRADPDENPYAPPAGDAPPFVYRPEWTRALFGAISLVVRATCVEPDAELHDAWTALVRAKFPARATAVFDDVSLVDFATVNGPLRAAMQSSDPLDEARWTTRLIEEHRALYRRVTALAREGQ